MRLTQEWPREGPFAFEREAAFPHPADCRVIAPRLVPERRGKRASLAPEMAPEQLP